MNYTIYISYDGMTDPLGQSQVIPYLKELSNSGFKIILISFEKKSRKLELKSIRNLLASSGIIWKPLTYHKKPAIPSTILDIILGTYFTLLYCKKYHVKIIHCRSYVPSIMVYLCRPFCKFRFIFDMRGFWADERIEGKIWNKSKLLHRIVYSFFKFMERKFIEDSDQVITLTEKAKTYIENNFKLKKEITVIPCSTDLNLFNLDIVPIENEEVTKVRKEGKLILIYIGSLGTWYELDKMLYFFKILDQIHPFNFLIITPDSKEIVLKEAKNQGINPFALIIKQSNRYDVPKWLRAADAGIFFIKPVFSKTASSPVKHGEMLASGLPVVINSGIGDLDEIIDKTKTGVILEDWEPETMKAAAQKLLELINKKNPLHYRDAAIDYYSLKTASARYSEIYKDLLGE